MSIDEIKPLLIVAVLLIDLVSLLALKRRADYVHKQKSDDDPYAAPTDDAEWWCEEDDAWMCVDEDAIPPIEYPPGD